MSTFALERGYELKLPTSFVDIDRDEMEYIDGGYELWQKALVATAIVAAGVGLIVALSYGQIYLAAKIFKVTFAGAVKKIGIRTVASLIGLNTGISSTMAYNALNIAF